MSDHHGHGVGSQWRLARFLGRFVSGWRVPSARSSRTLVVIYLAGGNDSLSFLVPYSDPAYYARRPTQAVPPRDALPLGVDPNGTVLGLHPCLPGMKEMFEKGHICLLPRVGYKDASRSHFVNSDILSTADPRKPYGNGWLGRYLEHLPQPTDPLAAWNTEFQLPRALMAENVGVPSIRDPAAYAYFHPWAEAEAATALADPERGDAALSFIGATTRAALATIPRVEAVAGYKPTVTYPTTDLARKLQLVASAIAGHVGTRIFWVQADGYDTHAAQGTAEGRFAKLTMAFDKALLAFHDDLYNQDLLKDTLVLKYSEFGRRIDENASQGTDHGAAGVMTLMGGSVQGGILGTAARSLAGTPDNPDLENAGRDVTYQFDFRSVYASLIDDWLGGNSTLVLGKNFRNTALRFLDRH